MHWHYTYESRGFGDLTAQIARWQSTGLPTIQPSRTLVMVALLGPAGGAKSTPHDHPGPHQEFTGVLPRFRRYCRCVRLLVGESSTFKFRQRILSGGFLLVGPPRSIETTVMEAGRGRSVIRGKGRVERPAYNRSFKWLVAP